MSEDGIDHRSCEDCGAGTPHKQVGDSLEAGRQYKCPACPERREIEAIFGIRGASDGSD